MGLSPLAGVPMGTRSGDIDACVVQFIMNKYNMSADDVPDHAEQEVRRAGSCPTASPPTSVIWTPAADKGNEACQLALDKFCL